MSGPSLCNNDDGAAIMWAHSRLIRNKAKRKIMIVLSDGSPACQQADAMPFTQKVVKEIEQKSPVELYGIGIMDDNVRRIYRDWKVIRDASELETALLSVVKDKIIG
jgi:cobalamin biosynthesis protein CobT